MRYKILKDGEVINTIVSDEDFCKAYCAENGYTYEEEFIPEPEPTEPEPTIEEIVNLMLGVNRYE